MTARPELRQATVYRLYAASAVLAMVFVVGVVARTSEAAFTASTDNVGNSFTADQIHLVDNDGESAMFEVPAMGPGHVVERCITVSYSSGAATADVVLYGTASGNLGQFLDLTIQYQDDASGTFPSCTGFAADGTIFDGPMPDFAAAHLDFDSGAGSWAVASGDSRVYRFRVELGTDNAAQGESAAADFVWEARTHG